MLIRACSGLRSSIIQHAGLFSIQLLLLLLVMLKVIVVVGVSGGEGEEQALKKKVTLPTLHAHKQTIPPLKKNPHI